MWPLRLFKTGKVSEVFVGCDDQRGGQRDGLEKLLDLPRFRILTDNLKVDGAAARRICRLFENVGLRSGPQHLIRLLKDQRLLQTNGIFKGCNQSPPIRDATETPCKAAHSQGLFDRMGLAESRLTAEVDTNLSGFLGIEHIANLAGRILDVAAKLVVLRCALPIGQRLSSANPAFSLFQGLQLAHCLISSLSSLGFMVHCLYSWFSVQKVVGAHIRWQVTVDLPGMQLMFLAVHRVKRTVPLRFSIERYGDHSTGELGGSPRFGRTT